MFPMISEDFLKQYAAGNLVLDCPRIVITQNKTTGPKTFEGPGMITLKADGRFAVRLYVNSPPGASHVIKAMFSMDANVSPGELIPDEYFYTMEATDLRGITWRNPSITPVFHGNNGEVIIADVDSLHAEQDSPESNMDSIVMQCFNVLPIPANAISRQSSESGEHSGSHKTARDRAEFVIGGIKFALHNGVNAEHGTKLIATAPVGTFKPGIEHRIGEALRFVTFTDFTFTVVEKVLSGTRHAFVRPIQIARTGILPAPVNGKTHVDDYWRLFEAYFRHVSIHTDPDTYHPLSNRLYPLIASHGVDFSVVELILGVSVEGVLNSEFASVGASSIPDNKEIADTVAVLKNLCSITETMKNRLSGAVTSMKQLRVGDQIKRLMELKVITMELNVAWRTVRNSSAHSANTHAKAMNVKVHDLYMVHALLMKLVLIAIGYKGKYQRFDLKGWPDEDLSIDKSTLV